MPTRHSNGLRTVCASKTIYRTTSLSIQRANEGPVCGTRTRSTVNSKTDLTKVCAVLDKTARRTGLASFLNGYKAQAARGQRRPLARSMVSCGGAKRSRSPSLPGQPATAFCELYLHCSTVVSVNNSSMASGNRNKDALYFVSSFKIPKTIGAREGV